MMEKIDQNEASGWTTNDLGELPDTSYVGDGSGYAYTEADMYAYALTQVRRAVAAERGGYITFDVCGEFADERRRELVLGLCRTLVEAGYVEFRISHSY
jgi:hypothetical protein